MTADERLTLQEVHDRAEKRARLTLQEIADHCDELALRFENMDPAKMRRFPTEPQEGKA